MGEELLFWGILFLVRLVEVPFNVAVMFLYAKNFRKRPHFKARLAGYVIILVAAVVLTNMLFATVLTDYMYSVIGSVIYILIQFFCMFLLYRENWKKIVSAFVLIYLSTTLPYYLIELVFTSCGITWTTSIEYMLYHLSAEVVIDIVYIFPLYYIYIKKVMGFLSDDIEPGIVGLLLYSIVITVIVNAFRETYVGWYGNNIRPISIFLTALIVADTVFVMFTVYIYLKGRASAREKEVIDTMWKQDKSRYEVRKETIAALNIKSHDIKNFLNKAKFSRAGGEEFEDDVEKVVQRFDSDIHTGNDALDVILSEHTAYCNAHGITLKYVADGSVLSGISEPDIYTLFDNILLNSTEYLSAVEDKDKRVCLIEVNAAKGMIHIHQENYFAGTLKRQNGEIQTTKEDAANHGYGLKSIRAIAEKYGGEMSVRTGGGLFQLNIMMMPSA